MIKDYSGILINFVDAVDELEKINNIFVISIKKLKK